MESLLTREALKEKRRSALSRRALTAPLILEKLKPLLVGPTLSFSSLPEEVDMTYVNEYLLRKGWLVLPRIADDQLALHLASDPLIQNRYGIWEPAEDAPLMEPDLGLIPGLAFDRAGGRIGYGKGYYDRLLSTLGMMTIGVAFEEQLYEALPQKRHDVAVQKLMVI